MTSRISYVVQGDTPNLDKGTLVRHIDRLKPSWIEIKNDRDFALMLDAAYQDMNTIYRVWPDDSRPKDWTPAQTVAFIESELRGSDLWFYLNNESGFDDVVLRWTCDVIDLAIPKGLKLVVGNFSVGTPQPDDWKRPQAVELLKRCTQFRSQVVLDLHEYSLAVCTSGFVGGNPTWIQPNTWPADTSNMTMWHCGRFRFLITVCKSLNLAPPRIIIGEAGFDDVSDLKAWADTLAKTAPYANIRGWKSLHGQWRQWWPMWDTEQAYYEQIAYLDKHVYQDSPVEAQLLFSWGKGNGDWEQFDVSGAGELQRLLEQYANAAPAPNWVQRIVQFKVPSTYKNIRKGASSTSDPIGQVYPGDLVYTDATLNGWFHVRKGEVMGYVSGDVVELVEQPAPPKPDPLEEVKPLWAKLITLEAEAATIRQQIADLLKAG